MRIRHRPALALKSRVPPGLGYCLLRSLPTGPALGRKEQSPVALVPGNCSEPERQERSEQVCALDSIAETAASANVQPTHLETRSLRESAREEAMPQPSGTKTTIHAATILHLGVVFVCDMRPPSCSFQIDTNWRGNKESPARAGVISLPFRRQFRRIPSPCLGMGSKYSTTVSKGCHHREPKSASKAELPWWVMEFTLTAASRNR